MKNYTLLNTCFELIDYLQERDGLTNKQAKFLQNTLNYCIKNNGETFVIYKVNNEKILIDAFLYDFIHLYDLTIEELLNNTKYNLLQSSI